MSTFKEDLLGFAIVCFTLSSYVCAVFCFQKLSYHVFVNYLAVELVLTQTQCGMNRTLHWQLEWCVGDYADFSTVHV